MRCADELSVLHKSEGKEDDKSYSKRDSSFFLRKGVAFLKRVNV